CLVSLYLHLHQSSSPRTLLSTLLLLFTLRRPPTSTLFPYTTLFRSLRSHPRSRLRFSLLRIFHRSVLGFDQARPRSFSRSRETRSEEHTSELQSLRHLVCRLLLEKKKKKTWTASITTEHTTESISPT